MEGGVRGRFYIYIYIYISLHCHPRMTTALRWAAMFLIVMDKVTRQRPQTTSFEEKGEAKRIRTEVTEVPLLTPRPYRLTADADRSCAI